jgi:tyrosinase
MRLNAHLALALFAGTLSNALPAPQSESADVPTVPATDDAGATEQIAQLAQFAQEQVNATLEAASSKRGSCNIFSKCTCTKCR